MNPQAFDLNNIQVASFCGVGWNYVERDDDLRNASIARFAVATLVILGSFSVLFGQSTWDTTTKIDASKLNIVHRTNDCAGKIAGLVIDPNGVVLPASRIRIYDKKKNKTSVISNEAGRYLIPNLATGRYILQIASRGFKTLSIDNIDLSGAECLEIKIEMELKTRSTWVKD